MSAIAPALFSLCDFPDYFQLTAWPASEAMELKNKLGWTDEQMYQMLSYFDLKNLATMISCPVFLNFSLQDDMCPPHCSWAFFNNLASQEKQFLTNPTLSHQTAPNWWTEFLGFFASHLRKENGIESTLTTDGQSQDYYSPDGRRLPHAPLRPGLYIRNWKKVVVR